MMPLSIAATKDTVPGSNSIIDIFYAPPQLWAATGRGVSQVNPPKTDWVTYLPEDGLGGFEIPAIGVFGSGAWASSAHSESREGQSIQWGDGIFLLDGLNDVWLDRSPNFALEGGGTISQASSAFMLCYDLATFRGRILGACFAGGLVLTDDDGLTWTNLFVDQSARNDFTGQFFNDLNNRYFSVVVDSSSADSLAVYAGSAFGINKLTFLDPAIKVTGSDFEDLALDENGKIVAASDNGLSISADRGGSWRTNHDDDGLPSSQVTAVAVNGDTIWAGFSNEDGTEGMGLAWSFDNGVSWIVPNPQPAASVGADHITRDIKVSSSDIWFACSDAGLLRLTPTDDPGNVSTDDYLTDREVLSLFFHQGLAIDELYVGTDIGIITFELDLIPMIVDTLTIGTVDDQISQRVIDVDYQELSCSDTLESLLWALTRQTDGLAGIEDGHAVSADGGATWTVSSRRIAPNDVAFLECGYFLATDSGLAQGNISNLDSLVFTPSYEARINEGRISRRAQSIAMLTDVDSVGNVILGTLWVGADSGLSWSTNLNNAWAVVFTNSDPSVFDQFDNFRYLGKDTLDNFVKLPGNFIPALGLQDNNGQMTIWASTRSTRQGRFTNDFNSGSLEVDGVAYSRDRGSNWSVPLENVHVWNFAFDGSEVWAAASEGILHWNGQSTSQWDTTRVFVDTLTGATVDSTIEILAVEIVNNEVWVGTENGLVILNKQGDVQSIKRTFQSVDAGTPGSEGGTYATPVPYSPTFSRSMGGLRIHYVPPVSGDVTIKIYDFSNNLVKTLTDREFREAGKQYDESDLWDGRNGSGDIVATGTYFYIIEYSNGTTHWGKIAIIP